MIFLRFSAVLALLCRFAFAAPVTPDPTFQTGTGPNGTVSALEAGPDGSLWIGGDFTSVDGQPRRYISKLEPDGALDPSFAPPSELFTISTLAPLPGGKVLAGAGHLGYFNGVTLRGISTELPFAVSCGSTQRARWIPHSTPARRSAAADR